MSLFLWIAGLLALVWIAMIMSRSYIAKGLFMALQSRRLGPDLQEMKAFHNREVTALSGLPWPKSSHEISGLTQQEIERLEDLGTTAFLVLKHGELLYEHYWHPYEASNRFNSFSVAKSIVGILTGTAVQKGLLGLDDSVAKYLPPFATEGRAAITIRHLLMMSSGLNWSESESSAWSDNARAYYGNDLLKMVGRLKLREQPGHTFRYASGNTQILGYVLSRVSGMTLSAYASGALWTPIGSEHHAYWNLDRKHGTEKAFCCFYATPSDLSRIGQLYLNEGTWNGITILSAGFVQESLSPVMLYDPLRRCPADHYGLHWWLAKYEGVDFFYARGIRGQYVICNRELKVIIVRMGHHRKAVYPKSGHPPDLFDHIRAGLRVAGF